MADKRISQLVDRGTVANNDVVPIVVSGATTTNKATISSIQTFMQGNLDLGVTSVGITLGSSGTDVSVTGSPITSSGNITINLPTASATNRGLLSAADWVTFNSKQDAGSFVTLDTTQTITAQKTFTTSGSSDTMIISHGSGSGFALDVLKAGNGEAIRVTKSSGTGNAMTISGGNFEAGTIVKTGGTSVQYLMADGSVSTLTNPITGTLATGQVAFGTAANTVGGSNNLFYDNANIKLGIGTNTPEATGLTVAGGGVLVSLDSTAARKVLELYATSTGAKVSSTYVGASSYGSLELLTSNIPRLTIADTGAATFSSGSETTSVSMLSTGSASGLRLQNTGGTAADWIIQSDGGAVSGQAALRFYSITAGAYRMSIDGSGNVGIGTATPARRLHAEGSPSTGQEIARFVNNANNSVSDFAMVTILGGNANNSSSYHYIAASGAADVLYILGNGNVANANNSYGAISDIKLKENIEDATPKLDDLMKVKVRNYNLIGDDKKQIGVIAQELEEVFPAMIDESEDFEDVEVQQVDEEGNEVLNEEGEFVTEKQRVSKGTFTKSVKYSVFVPMLIKAIQELKTEIDSLKNQIK